MFLHHRRFEAVIRPRPRARFGAASTWVSVRRRRRLGPRPAPPGLRAAPVPEPVSIVERNFFNRPAFYARIAVPVAGKTGTAQTPDGSDHSWYASWAPADRPRVVVVVLIEHGGFGAEAAAPAAREIYSAFFHVR
jgi:hypothetical protein